MNSGYYAACAGLLARSDNLEIAANNLANVNTSGYKAQKELFRTVLASSQAVQNPLSASVNSFGVLGGATVDLQAGQTQFTGNDLDVAIQGPGFFAVQTKNGIRYTRNGSFQLSPTGQLTTTNGDPVLGTDKTPIQVPSGKVSISPDGTISVNGATAGQLPLFDFPAGTTFTPEGNGYYQAPQGSATPATATQLRQGALEGSNMDAVSGAISLIVIQRHAEMLQKALSIFHSDFNRIAAQDLPRAGS